MIANEEAKGAIFNSTLIINSVIANVKLPLLFKKSVCSLLYTLKIISMYIILFLDNSHPCPKIYFFLFAGFN